MIGVQNLIKKHQAVLAEINNHDSRISAVVDAGKQMMEDEHFASDEIRNRVNALYEHWVQLKDKANQVSHKFIIHLKHKQNRFLLYSASKIWRILCKLTNITLMQTRQNRG